MVRQHLIGVVLCCDPRRTIAIRMEFVIFVVVNAFHSSSTNLSMRRNNKKHSFPHAPKIIDMNPMNLNAILQFSEFFGISKELLLKCIHWKFQKNAQAFL